MSRYTTQLRYLVESGYPIFDFSYPIFDENYKQVLEDKFINNFYFREIGFETAARFKWALKNKLNLIMPYYNQLYSTEHLITKDNFNINNNSVETHTKISKTDSTNENSMESSSESSSNSKDVFQDTPQGKTGSLDYATNINDSDNTANGKTDGTSNSNAEVNFREDYEIKLTGGSGLRYDAEIMKIWRDTFLNIDQMILDECNELFMNIY